MKVLLWLLVFNGILPVYFAATIHTIIDVTDYDQSDSDNDDLYSHVNDSSIYFYGLYPIGKL